MKQISVYLRRFNILEMGWSNGGHNLKKGLKRDEGIKLEINYLKLC